jgi:hypothetical protein
MRRAVLELQFNWIFVLIVGTIILAFFLGIVMKQKDISKATTGVKLSTDLETITTGAEVSKGTAQIIKLPNFGIEFNSEGCLRRYSIGGGTKEYREKIIFAPTSIKGSEVLAWTLDWSVPYRVTNFLYLTSTQMRYLLVDFSGVNQLAAQINRSLPDEMYKELFGNANEIENQNNYKIRLVYFSTPPSQIVVPDTLQSTNDKDVSALNIESSYPYATGTLTFYRKSGPTSFVKIGDSHILGMLSIYGAIFTDDYETYNCNMREAFHKMRMLTEIIQNRTELLYNEPSLYSCSNEYYLSLVPSGPLYTLHSESQALTSEFPSGASDQHIDSLYSAIEDLQGINRNLQLQSCPEIY